MRGVQTRETDRAARKQQSEDAWNNMKMRLANNALFVYGLISLTIGGIYFTAMVLLYISHKLLNLF